MSDRETTIFEAFIERLVLDALERDDLSPVDLFRRLPGVYPSEVLMALSRLSVNGTITKEIYGEILESVQDKIARGGAERYLGQNATLPLPHPLDFDWRFTAATAEHIVNTCAKLSGPRDQIVFLGAPTVFSTAIRNNSDRGVVLLDRNIAIVSHISETFPGSEVYLCDLLSGHLHDVSAAVVVIDPPWYSEHFEAFMWAASRLCDLHGHALVSLPAVGTRPGVLSEREHIVRWSTTVGFTLEKYEEGALRYVSPPFEVNALRAERLHNVPMDWRCADLAIFRKELVCNVPRPSVMAVSESWAIDAIDDIQWRTRTNGRSEFCDPDLRSILEGDVLCSVSRREALREQADVWTTGNRIYSCAGTNILRIVIQTINSGNPLHASVANALGVPLGKKDRALTDQAARKVEDIVKIERAEIGQYFGRI